MPAGYTHYQFSEDIIQLIDDHQIKQIITANKTLFQIGTHGPDIFFFHRVYNFHDDVNLLGKQMHREKARDFFENALEIADNDDQKAYILGFLCHYILDSQMHRYVKQIMSETQMSHFEVESEYDRYILKRKRIDPVNSYIYSHIQCNEHIVCTIHSFFPQLSYLQIQESLHSVKAADKLLRAPSYLKRGILYSAFHLSFHFDQLQGLIINYHHNTKMENYYYLLNQIYKDALSEAMTYISLYFDNFEKKEVLPVRFDRTYQ